MAATVCCVCHPLIAVRRFVLSAWLLAVDQTTMRCSLLTHHARVIAAGVGDAFNDYVGLEEIGTASVIGSAVGKLASMPRARVEDIQSVLDPVCCATRLEVSQAIG